MLRFYRKINRYVTLFSLIVIALGLISLGLHIACSESPAFADFMNAYISQPIRSVLAWITSVIPFSLAEFLLLTSPVTVIAVSVVVCRHASRGGSHFVRCFVGTLSFLVLIYSVFVFTYGVGYYTTPMEDKLELERRDVSAEELYNTMTVVIDKLNELSAETVYAEDVGSLRPYSHDHAVELCVESYASLAEKYDFIPKLNAPVKQIVLSEHMTYTHISGIYTFFTGEANLNTNYPYFVNVFTTAHEMAHQRGIAREDEANFMAYLVCINSEDPYMQYSGYLNMYEYLATPLYNASPKLYSEAVRELDLTVKYDLRCYSEFFDKYRDNVAADVSDAVNDTYLKVVGTEGTKSYGMVVDLAVAYYRPLFETE